MGGHGAGQNMLTKKRSWHFEESFMIYGRLMMCGGKFLKYMDEDV